MLPPEMVVSASKIKQARAVGQSQAVPGKRRRGADTGARTGIVEHRGAAGRDVVVARRRRGKVAPVGTDGPSAGTGRPSYCTRLRIWRRNASQRCPTDQHHCEDAREPVSCSTNHIIHLALVLVRIGVLCRLPDEKFRLYPHSVLMRSSVRVLNQVGQQIGSRCGHQIFDAIIDRRQTRIHPPRYRFAKRLQPTSRHILGSVPPASCWTAFAKAAAV